MELLTSLTSCSGDGRSLEADSQDRSRFGIGSLEPSFEEVYGKDLVLGPRHSNLSTAPYRTVHDRGMLLRLMRYRPGREVE